MNNLFVYGTLMIPKISKKIFGKSSKEKAELNNFRRSKIICNNMELFYPALFEKNGAQTEDILFRNLSDEELALIDEYEGDEYERIMVKIKSQNIVTDT